MWTPPIFSEDYETVDDGKEERKVIIDKRLLKEYTDQELNALVEDFKKEGINESVDIVEQWLSRWCSMPLDEMPLYINSDMVHERVISRWRLKVAR